MPTLKYYVGTGSPRIYSVHKPVTTVGKAPGNDVVINGEVVQPTHVQISFDGRDFIIEELNKVGARLRELVAAAKGDEQQHMTAALEARIRSRLPALLAAVRGLRVVTINVQPEHKAVLDTVAADLRRATPCFPEPHEFRNSFICPSHGIASMHLAICCGTYYISSNGRSGAQYSVGGYPVQVEFCGKLRFSVGERPAGDFALRQSKLTACQRSPLPLLL